MAIAPVSQVSFNSVSFQSKDRNNKKHSNNIPQAPQRGTDISKLPLALLLAITPSVVNPAEPKPFSDNPTPITLVDTPQEPQDTPGPYGYESLKYETIVYTHKFHMNNGEYTMLFTSKYDTNNVDFVYIIPKNSKGGKTIYDNPPRVRQLRYHNIGKDKEFCGAVIHKDAKSSETDEYVGTYMYELKLPDETAQKIIDLVTSHSRFNNCSIVNIAETNSPKLLESKVY